jgi:hypothetical protein
MTRTPLQEERTLMLTAATLTDQQIMDRVAQATVRFERGVDTVIDREVVRIYKTAMFPHMAMAMLSDEDHAEVVAVRARLVEILNES